MAMSEQSILAQLEGISQVAAKTVRSGSGDIEKFREECFCFFVYQTKTYFFPSVLNDFLNPSNPEKG